MHRAHAERPGALYDTFVFRSRKAQIKLPVAWIRLSWPAHVRYFPCRAHASWGLGTIFFQSPTRPFALGKRTSRYLSGQFKFSAQSPPWKGFVFSDIANLFGS